MELINKAIKVLKNSYAPYSNIHVAAAIKTKDGRIYVGVNVENSSYGLTICAERVAIFNAITHGEREFIELAIVTDYKEPIPPCGACRQVLAEFCRDLKILMYSIKSSKLVEAKLSELLPQPFKLN